MAGTRDMTDALSDPPSAWPPDPDDGRTSTSRVVLVDPSPIGREALRSAIGSTDDLACAWSGPSLAAAGEGGVAEVDAVVVMATSPGLDLAREVATARQGHPRAAVIVLSGYVDDYLVDHLVERGASIVTSTDIGLTELFDLVRVGRVASAPSAPATTAIRAAAVAESFGITPRELDVLRNLAEGRSPQQIARRLGVALDTVRGHLKQLRSKLDCANAVELLVSAHRVGLLPNLGRPLR